MAASSPFTHSALPHLIPGGYYTNHLHEPPSQAQVLVFTMDLSVLALCPADPERNAGTPVEYGHASGEGYSSALLRACRGTELQMGALEWMLVTPTNEFEIALSTPTSLGLMGIDPGPVDRLIQVGADAHSLSPLYIIITRTSLSDPRHGLGKVLLFRHVRCSRPVVVFVEHASRM